MSVYKLTEHKNHENLSCIFRIFYSEFSYGIFNSNIWKSVISISKKLYSNIINGYFEGV